MRNSCEPCIVDKCPCQSGTERQKVGVFAYIYALAATERADDVVEEEASNNVGGQSLKIIKR